ncbi:MAG: RNA polymerase sigma factor [Candidatus Eisenbacteria bacterium]|nr:RNA polymerase sigma factor [Candidatus Eisenbacteria bacterium]
MEHAGSAVTARDRAPGTVPAAAELKDAAAAAAGDTRAFERLYRAHVARIHSLARRMLGADLAGEVTQDVFVRAWQKLGTFRGEAAFGTWLHRLAVNVVLAERARLGTRRGRFAEGEGVMDALAARPAATDAGLDFDAAIERLPEGARQVFVLHDVEGYRHEEIASLLGVTSGTTKAQLHRARMLLRRHLGS